jgi:hypothetical protein
VGLLFILSILALSVVVAGALIWLWMEAL